MVQSRKFVIIMAELLFILLIGGVQFKVPSSAQLRLFNKTKGRCLLKYVRFFFVNQFAS